MNIFIYSDESGVFDNQHENYFVFGGLIFFSKEDKDNATRKFKAVEKNIRSQLSRKDELKANTLSPKNKRRLYSSLGEYNKFGVVIKMNKILKQIFLNKKSKQRYLDYAFKIGVKYAITNIAKENNLSLSDIKNIYFFCDEHTTATDGKYELKEALEQEYKFGTFNSNYHKYFPPIIPSLERLELKYCDSDTTILIRAADIIANRIYHYAKTNNLEELTGIHLCSLP